MHLWAGACVCACMCVRVCACAPPQHRSTMAQRHHSGTTTAPQRHGTTAPWRHGARAPQHHHTITAQYHNSATAPRHHSEKRHDRFSIIFLARRSLRCSIGEAHATSANSTSLVDCAKDASATCGLGETSLRPHKRRPMSEIHARRHMSEVNKRGPTQDRQDF